MSKPKTFVISISTAIAIMALTTLKVGAGDLPQSIFAITSNQRPIQPVDCKSASSFENNPEITILNLDAAQSLHAQLSKGLPNDETLARTVVQQKIANIDRSKLEDELRTAYLPLGTMMAYGLDRYPVIIFDQQAVIYGVTDSAQAINQFPLAMITSRIDQNLAI